MKFKFFKNKWLTPSRLTFLCLAFSVIAACSEAPDDREALAQKIEHAETEASEWAQRMKAVALEGSKSQEERNKIFADNPFPGGMSEILAVQKIIDANPSDKHAFTAAYYLVNYVFSLQPHLASMERGSELKMSVVDAIEKYHLNNPELPSLLFTLTKAFPEKNAFELLDNLIEKSEVHATRGTAAFRAASIISVNIDANRIAPGELAQAKLDLERYANIAINQYPDVVDPSTGSVIGDAAEGILYKLNGLKVGETLPNAVFPDLEGKEDSLEKYRGKVVLLDFWATWCGPCVAGLPKLVDLKEQYADEQFEIISVSLDGEADTVISFQNELQKMPWVNWISGPDHEMLGNWGVIGIPYYILIDSDGIIHYKGKEVGDDAKKVLRTLIHESS